MNTTTRYAILVLVVVLGLHSILSFTHESYGRATSLSNISSKLSFNGSLDEPDLDVDILEPRANATLLMLARNSETDTAVRSVRELEDRFNHKHHYPWVFLNEQPFSDDFKTRVSNVVSGSVEFGLIPHDHWHQPDWIDEEKASQARQKMVQENTIYGGSVSYRNMCRFNSGFFYKHPIVQKYKWYWRVEPDVHFHCDIDEDPFLFMENNDKLYGFTISTYEFHSTIPTLWDTVKKFIAENPQYVAKDNAMGYLSDDGGNSYNMCHFWSNFEIANMDLWRGEAYTKYFEYLDSTGGFYYERWGDAPVHSIAAALFARKDQIYFFEQIGYEHNPNTHCPKVAGLWSGKNCSCNPANNFDYSIYSCMPQWERIQ
ncbi:glycosyltransferase family 15 protein [Phanerochaete carnosa HHB-10118-sp]|uniref:Glycosyltransferase family 15 protein n=1 Tax=Phanerochaete carnosa (strain HHB-10118-sp) TaxID=650164 RepID=K5VW10_PHACS|nr:glycosyltransferase family 15 protein [Phanerochaete carnosa HHB-10118-sp]EKM51000.1 glycosyltransferase family 15 protein [Phanerochaete carnosa HHB-10118-sp]